MKHLVAFAAVLLLVFSSCVPPQQQPEENTVDSYQDFYDGLSPYGHWVNHPSYGYIWMPEVGPDFQPYSTDGYWVWTNYYGWTWVSDYQWGWAPFHYGRWNFEDEYGWYWVPDLTWGPAWVAWREAPGYYGWAPLRPGISVEFAIGGGYEPPEEWWTVCDNRYLGDREMHRHYERVEHRGHILDGESRGIGNTSTAGGTKRESFLTGPAREDVQKVTGRAIQEVKIEQSSRPGQTVASNNTLNVYRPPVQRVAVSRAKPVPTSITTTRDIRDLHQQANPNYTGSRGGAPPRETTNQARQNSQAPREQTEPRQQAEPRRQSEPRQAPPVQRTPPPAAPRNNGQSNGGGRPK